MALDLKTGEQIWQTNINKPYGRSQNHVEAAASIAEGIVCIMTGRGMLDLDLKTGKVQWVLKYDTGTNDTAIANGIIYFYSWKHPRRLMAYKG